MKSGVPMYTDSNHLSEAGAMSLEVHLYKMLFMASPMNAVAIPTAGFFNSTQLAGCDELFLFPNWG